MFCYNVIFALGIKSVESREIIESVIFSSPAGISRCGIVVRKTEGEFLTNLHTIINDEKCR